MTAPGFGIAEKETILGFFPPDDLEKIEALLSLQSPADEFRHELAFLIWKRLRSELSLKNVKRRVRTSARQAATDAS